MKNVKLLVLLMLLCVGFFFNSCVNDELVTAEETLISNIDLDIIKRMGFNTDNIVDKGDYYVVEGDIVIDKTDLTCQTKQYHSGRLIAPQNWRNIKIRIDNSVYSESDWATALEQAVNAWNTEPECGLFMKLVTSGDNMVVYIDNGIGESTIAVGAQPQGGNPGRFVSINAAYNSLSLGEKTWIIMHELGHTVGLRHTDVTQGVHLPSTPEDASDLMSLMKSSHSNQSWPLYSFTNYDIIALQRMYPNPSLISISGPSDIYINSPAEYTLVNLPKYYKVNYWRWSNGITVYDTSGLSATTQFEYAGEYELYACIQDLNSSVSEIISIPVKVHQEALYPGRIGHPQHFGHMGNCYLRVISEPSGGLLGATVVTWEYNNGSGWRTLTNYYYDGLEPGSITALAPSGNVSPQKTSFRRKIVSGNQVAYTNIVTVYPAGTEITLDKLENSIYVDFFNYGYGSRINARGIESTTPLGAAASFASTIDPSSRVQRIIIPENISYSTLNRTIKLIIKDEYDYIHKPILNISQAANYQLFAGTLFPYYNNAISRGETPTPIAFDSPPFWTETECPYSQWQYSHDQSKWFNITGANDPWLYQPGPLYNTTYYRLHTVYGDVVIISDVVEIRVW